MALEPPDAPKPGVNPAFVGRLSPTDPPSGHYKGLPNDVQNELDLDDSTREQTSAPTRLHARKKRKMHCRFQLMLTSTEATMLDRIRDHFDMPVAIIMRLWIRQHYEQLYANDELDAETLKEIQRADTETRRAAGGQRR